MIGSIRGRIARKEANRLLVEAGGIGYLVHIPFSTFFALGDVGSETSLLVHTHVREDALQLFGFGTTLELSVFEKLIGVSGIGPRMALTILSGIPAADLVAAIQREDLRRLTTVPGLGKKTSERLVVELRDKLLQLSSPTPDLPPGDEAADLLQDVVSALVNLGYRQKDAEAAAKRADAGSRSDFESLLRATLGLLGRAS